jgi:hypothetical protein
VETATAVAEFEAQGVLQPGDEGWWKVWGAGTRHIRPGDIVMHKCDGEVLTEYVTDTFTAKAAPLRVGVVIGGERVTLGALVPIVLLRRGTRNTLAGA